MNEKRNTGVNKDSGGKYYYEVALPLKLKGNLIYSSCKALQKGDSVFVSLRNKKTPAVVLKEVPYPKQKSFEIKTVLSEDKERERLSSARLKWLSWLSEYYQYSLGQVIHLSFPPRLRRTGKNKAVTSSSEGSPASTKTSGEKGSHLISEHLCMPKTTDSSNPPIIKMTEEQEKCLKEIQMNGTKGFRVHLLHGVTGSGKTEIYFRLIEPALKQGAGALILVPEIALTPQHINRFSLRFPGQVACFHSGFSPKKKHKQWVSVLKGDKKILIGPRSALFCPLPRLSWIIVDEEHESHFKQEEKLKYHGRDAAVYLGQCLDIPVVLASATPSLESWWNARSGKYIYHCLKKRVFETPAPKITVVDMKTEKNRQSDLPYWLSREMYKAVTQSLKKNEQVALFLNRRGESAYIFCPSCGYHFSCLNCDISLTQHQVSHLLCHYCGYREEKRDICPKCGKEEISSFGAGTATLQKELQILFPTSRIVRADRDAVKTHKQWAELLVRIEDKKVDIVVGTQMIAKGLDFPHLNLVGLILADQGLNWPDFRSSEKNFQLITQMAGRSGRRKQAGWVILQSYNPSHPVIKAVKEGNYEPFANQELSQRKKYLYPPFGKLSLLRIQSASAPSAWKLALNIRDQLKYMENLRVLGPAPAPHFRLRNKYRYHLLLKSPHSIVLGQAGNCVLNLVSKAKIPAVQVHINRDPVYMF